MKAVCIFTSLKMCRKKSTHTYIEARSEHKLLSDRDRLVFLSIKNKPEQVFVSHKCLANLFVVLHWNWYYFSFSICFGCFPLFFSLFSVTFFFLYFAHFVCCISVKYKQQKIVLIIREHCVCMYAMVCS